MSQDIGAGIVKQSMGAKNRVGIGLSYRPARLHRLAGRYDNAVPTRRSKSFSNKRKKRRLWRNRGTETFAER